MSRYTTANVSAVSIDTTASVSGVSIDTTSVVLCLPVVSINNTAVV